MALPTRPVAPQKKRLPDAALDALAARMATEKSAQKPGTVATSPRAPAAPAKALPDLSGKPSGSVTTSPRPPGSGAPAKPAAPDESSLDYLSRLRAEQDRVTEATKADLAAGKAKASLDAGARAGAAGMGLSGATAALKSDIGRQQDRGAVLALDELARRQTDQEFQAIGQQAAIIDYEDAYDLDMDGDGMVGDRPIDSKSGVGDGDPENDIEGAPTAKDAQKAALAEQLSIYDTDDYSAWDENTQPGSVQEPYKYRGGKESLEAMLREIAPDALPLTKQEYDTGNPFDGKRTVYVDKFGNAYVLDASQSTRRG
jgi:hypothetical protein